MLESILHPIHLKELAKQWMLEDVTNYDFGGGVVGDTECEFTIFMKSPGVLAGIPFANAVFSELGLKANWIHKEGEKIFPITPVVKIFGSARKLLLAERIVLNVLSRASGVATIASNMKSQLESVGWKGALAGTRKTTPGFRMVEKYALLVGGADTHRYDLSSMVMLKDNHVTISGSIETAVKKAREFCGFSQKIEVECQSLDEATEACHANCDVVMLDNFEPEELKRTALAVKHQYPKVLIEASGGITCQNITNYTCPYVDIISSSSLVQGYETVDFSMKASQSMKATKLTLHQVE
ncbi:nicotinate-nucleotide pyrophosphorylase [carboxylating]-like isoform X1 [Uloborus diversus]|uniref:nicotinate-nucleotide pyrophosphorylase [carboxylating]-like isoform X1 n=1 Tax=Uloborus diversus TaxID=327109 RepID=UPI002409A7C3|nr:nicotinate-nucleotide pyrophosphorylase [carboxylating]-like isoform X1 [Uloborus diversus]